LQHSWCIATADCQSWSFSHLSRVRPTTVIEWVSCSTERSEPRRYSIRTSPSLAEYGVTDYRGVAAPWAVRPTLAFTTRPPANYLASARPHPVWMRRYDPWCRWCARSVSAAGLCTSYVLRKTLGDCSEATFG
jgi:hypothetical protein